MVRKSTEQNHSEQYQSRFPPFSKKFQIQVMAVHINMVVRNRMRQIGYSFQLLIEQPVAWLRG